MDRCIVLRIVNILNKMRIKKCIVDFEKYRLLVVLGRVIFMDKEKRNGDWSGSIDEEMKMEYNRFFSRSFWRGRRVVIGEGSGILRFFFFKWVRDEYIWICFYLKDGI